MYDYIKKNFPGSIITPEIKENKYGWRFHMGGVRFVAIDICLTNIKGDWWDIYAAKKEVYDGHADKPIIFQYSCSADDDLGKFILDRIGKWLEEFAEYKEFQDEIHEDPDKRQYKVILGTLKE